MTYYSFQGRFPEKLPHRIKLSNGTTRTDSSTFTAEEIQDAGGIEVEDPPSVQHPNRLGWDSENMKWLIKEPDVVAVGKQLRWIREECQRKLAETDYKVIKALEAGVPLDPIYVQYRQELRDLYNNVDTLEDPWNIVFPQPIFPEDDLPEVEDL